MIDSSNLTIEEKDGIITVEGYLFRYKSPQDNTDKDLHNQYWTKNTYLMEETFPIKGIPIMFGHSLENEFTRIGIGIVNYANEDDIGLFIKGQLHKREKWIKIVEEVNRRRKLGLNRKQIEQYADRAYSNIKSVVSKVPLQWSMGSYEPTYSTNRKTGEIETAGVVEATLTPSPAEPKGTEAIVSIKSIFDTLQLKELNAKEDEGYYNFEHLKIYFEKEEKKLLTKEEQMKALFNDFTKQMVEVISDEAQKEAGEDAPVTEDEKSEMKSFIISTIQEIANKDTGFKQAVNGEEFDKENVKSILSDIVDSNMKSIVVGAIDNYIEKREKTEKQTRKSVTEAFADRRKNSQDNPKSGQAGSTSQKGFDVEVVNNEVGLGDFFRDVYLGRTPNGGHTSNMKDINPYVGALGGVLTGQEMSQTILDPLRPQVVTFGMGITETRVNNIGVYTRPKMTTVPNAYRPGINDQITATEVKYDTVSAMLRPLAARVVIPRQMLMTTGTNMEQQLRTEIIRSLRLQIDKEILEGVGNVSGTGNTGAEIRGIKRVLAGSDVSATNLVTLATNGRKPKFDDLINAETQIHENNVELDASTSGWIMHPRDKGTFRRTTDATGQPLLMNNYSENGYSDLVGYKVATTTQISNNQTTGTSTDTSDIYFGNWRYGEYVIGNDIEVILDDMTLADQLQVRFIVYLYSDFIVHYPEAFYVMQGVRA